MGDAGTGGLEVWGGTDVGMKRRLNEDVFLIDREAGVYLVADGMGGHAAGEVASKLAAEEIRKVFRIATGMDDGTWPAGRNLEATGVADLLREAILAGHERVTEAVTHDESLEGMGTTVVVAIQPPGTDQLVVGHVGDSRAYRFRNGELELLTMDHSWVHEQMAAGFLSEKAARSHPLKNVVTQALGGSSTPRVDILETDLLPGDLYLLCSDGLNSMLSDEQIAGFLEKGGPLDELGSRLLVEANRHGGNDNITVVLLRA